eukprot:9658754-Alexandrium_andersonii.AAC.2
MFCVFGARAPFAFNITKSKHASVSGRIPPERGSRWQERIGVVFNSGGWTSSGNGAHMEASANDGDGRADSGGDSDGNGDGRGDGDGAKRQ